MALRKLLVTAAGTALVVACGGTVGTGVEPEGAQGGGGATYTLDDVCERIAPRTCALRRPCCERASTWDEAGCIANARAECERDVADVRVGQATFYPDRIDPCLEELAPLFANCTVTFDVIARVASAFGRCRVFEGRQPVGGACERDSQCSLPNPSSFPTCDADTKTCRSVTFLADGDRCQIADPPTSFCGEGLFCDADFTAQPPTGSCRVATAIGQPCDAGKALALECGIGNYCDKATGLCARGKGANAPCEDSFECASLSCQAGVAGKRCTPPNDLVKPADCGRPG